MIRDEIKALIVQTVEYAQAYLGVTLKRDLADYLGGNKMDLVPVFDELVAERRTEKAEFLVPIPPDSWQYKTVYFPKGTQFWNCTTQFVTPH